jgi:hypothetical protein
MWRMVHETRKASMPVESYGWTFFGHDSYNSKLKQRETCKQDTYFFKNGTFSDLLITILQRESRRRYWHEPCSKTSCTELPTTSGFETFSSSGSENLKMRRMSKVSGITAVVT